MKYPLVTLAVVASTALAVAVPDPVPVPEPNPVAEPMPWCSWKGQPCWKEKMKLKAKREAIPNPVPAPQPDPVAEPMPWCSWKGQPCWKEKAKMLKAKREAEPIPKPDPVPAPKPDPVAEPKPWCSWKGQPCWKVKRDAGQALSDTLTARSRDTRSIDAPNAAQQAKRSINDLANLITLSARDTPAEDHEDVDFADFFSDEEPKAKANTKRNVKTLKEEKRLCMWKGQPCYTAKRAAEAVLDVVGGSHDTRGFSPENSEEKRDLIAIHAVARSIADSYEE